MSVMVSFCAVLFPRDVLDEILNLIESVSEGFPSYSPYIIRSADYILFQSFEIRGYILNNQKILTGLDSCFRPPFFNPLGHF